MPLTSYHTLALEELIRYLGALERASEEIREQPIHAPHTERVRAIHDMVYSYVKLYGTDYFADALGETICLHTINETNQLVPHPNRSTWERYLNGIRSVVKRMNNAYVFKSVFAMCGLEWLAGNSLNKISTTTLTSLKHLETVLNTLEVYLTWLEHGASLASKYNNATLSGMEEETEDDKEEEENQTTPSDFYSNIYVRAYAMLKTFEKESQQAAQLLTAIGNSLNASCDLVGIFQKIYVDVPPTTVENTLHTLVTPKSGKPNYQGTKFPGLQELNEKLRSMCKESLGEPHGVLFIVTELLKSTHAWYLSDLADNIIETLAFLTTEHAQDRFIREFEQGTIWQDDGTC